MILARWLLDQPLPVGTRPCLIRVAGDSTWCESCGARWDTNDPHFSFCGRSIPRPREQHAAVGTATLTTEGWLTDLLERASKEETDEARRATNEATARLTK